MKGVNTWKAFVNAVVHEVGKPPVAHCSKDGKLTGNKFDSEFRHAVIEGGGQRGVM